MNYREFSARCDCGSLDHQLTFTYDTDEDPDFFQLYVHIHLATWRNIFQRVWVALKYILGYKSRFGCWDEILINKEATRELRNFIDDYLKGGCVRRPRPQPMSRGEEKVKIHWYCGYYVGPPKWQGLEVYEPDECATEFETLEDLDDWEEGICTATCPSCGANLTQDYDEPRLVGGKLEMSIEIFIADIIAKDEEGREFPKRVTLRADHTGVEWILDFGWPASYYLSDLLDPTKFPRKGLCIDAGGRNHRGSPVWVDLETFLLVVGKALAQILEYLRENRNGKV